VQQYSSVQTNTTIDLSKLAGGGVGNENEEVTADVPEAIPAKIN
jgi:hypothetical protein